MSVTFFGLQLALDLPHHSPLRPQLAAALHELRQSAGGDRQRAGWMRAAEALLPAARAARMGAWDLIRENGQGVYEQWVGELEAMAGWQGADFGQDGTYVLATIVMLVQGGSNSDHTLGDCCDIPEAHWLMRGTYLRLIGALPRLNYTNVIGSAWYLAPHPECAGFSAEVLAGDGFDYLQAVQA
jgi:hypothetical protein